MPFNVGPFELLLVLIVVLLVVGPGKLPEVGNALGRTIREFRRTSSEVEESLRVEPTTARATTAGPVATATDRSADVREDRAAS